MDNELKKMLDWYDTSYHTYGDDDYRSLTWGDKQGNNAQKRYHMFNDIYSLSENSIIEVGCGWGSIFDFGYQPTNYVGIDVNKRFIDKAIQKYPNHTFIASDIHDYKTNDKFDVCIASGVAGNRGGPCWHPTKLLDFFKQCNLLADVSLINFPSIWASVRSDNVEYFSPETVLSVALQVTRNVEIKHFDNFDFLIILK